MTKRGLQMTKILAVVLLCVSVSQAALPPSQQTREEVLWEKLSRSASADLVSDATVRLIGQFLADYPEHPKAVNAAYMQAEADFKRGDFQKSAVEFEKFVAKYPEHPLADSAAFRLAESYYNAEAYNSAYTAWERMTQKYKSSALVADALEYMAVLRIRGKEWGRADELMKRLRSDYPEFGMLPRVRENHGVILYHLGDYRESADVLNGIEEGKGAFYRGLSLFSLTLYEDAVAALANINIDKPGPYTESGAFLKAEGFFQKRNYNLAVKEFKAFKTAFPSSALVAYADMRVAACAFLLKDPVEAIAAANRALQGSVPAEVQVYSQFIKGSALLDQTDYTGAAALFTKVAERNDYPALAAASLVRKAWAFRNLMQFPAFEKTLKTLEEKYPSSPQMSFGKYLEGAYLFEKEQWEEAGSRFETAVIRYPYGSVSEAALALMTIAYTRANRLDQLVTAANSALKIFEGHYTSQSVAWRAHAYHFIGRAFYETGRYAEAIPFFEKLTVNFSDHQLAPRSQLYLAWCLLETGKYDKAREKARVLAENPKTDKTLAIYASFLDSASFFNAKQYDKALGRLAEFAKKYPKDNLMPQVRYLIGLAFHQKKVFGSAVDHWNKLINEHPNHPLAQDAYLHIGDLYFKSAKFEDAAKFFRSFRDRWPKSKYEQLAFWLELQAYFNGEKDETAIKVYPTYIQAFPNADNIEDAKKQLETVYYRRGQHGDPVKLEEFLTKYPKSPYAPSARYKLGDMAMEQKAWNRASQEMEQFLRDYPKDALYVDALYALGLAYESAGQKEKAVVQYRQLMQRFQDKPTAVDAAFRLGSVFFAEEKFEEALKAFQFASKKKLTDELRSNILYNIAICHENMGQLEEAAEAYGTFAKATKKPEQRREALLTAGLLLKKAEKHQMAIPYFTTLLKDAGSKEVELQAVNLLAESQAGAGSTGQAMKTYERLVAMGPPSSDLRLAGLAQLAYLYEQKKSFDDAVRVYEKIAASKGKQEWIRAAKDRIAAINKEANALP